jgi:glycosyltransferase involved in cell wall biosynthesis
VKIGFDLAQCSMSNAGGGWYASSLFKAMTKGSPETDFVAYLSFGNWINRPESSIGLPNGLNITDPLAGASFENSQATWSAALDACSFPGSPDLVHSTSFQSPKLISAKLVVTIYDLSFWVHPEFTTDRIRLDCQRGVINALERADGLIFISEHSRREFHRLLPLFSRREDIRECVTPLGCRLRPPSSYVQPAVQYWLAVGTLEPRKNLGNLLEAYSLYATKHPNPKPLWLAGPSGWKTELFQPKLNELVGRGLVRQLGYVDDDMLAQLYAEAYAFIFPSWYEGFGLPVLEAMTLGCAVITTNQSSLPEVAGNAAIYIDPQEPAQIVAAMRQLESDPHLLETLRTEGRRRSQEFSWEETAKRTLAFYADVLSAE